MAVRIDLREGTEEARAELARLQPRRSTYLGLPVGYWLATAVAGLALGLGLSAAVDRPSAEYLECWELLAAGDWDGAGCAGQWPALAEWAEELWGPDGDPETGGTL